MSAVLLPHSLTELWAVLCERPDGCLMAGGTDLLPARRRAPADERPLVCLERIPELHEIREQPDGGLEIGAGVSFARLAAHPTLRADYPVLAQAAASVGAPAIRAMATIGGNICTASPAGDSLPPLYLLDAVLTLHGPTGKRRLPIAEAISGPRRTVLAPDEILVVVTLPPPRPWQVQRYDKIGRRNALAIAVASLATAIRLDDDGRVTEARFAWGSVGPTVLRCAAAEQALCGRPLTQTTLADAAALADAVLQPIDDLRASAWYRRQVANNLLLRLAR